MRCTHGGKTYEIRFKHEDYRYTRTVDGETGKVKLVPVDARVLRRTGQGSTRCLVLEVTGKTEDGKTAYGEVLAASEVRCSPKDVYSKAHGRWYALERALLDIGDTRLVRALRKAMYDRTRWRPDGKDGYYIDAVKRETAMTTKITKELVRVGG